MEIHTRHTPAYGVARIVLGGGEQVLLERGAMMASSFGMTAEPVSGRQPGLAAAQSRFRSGKGAARDVARPGQVVFTAPHEGGWLDVAPTGPGDVCSLVLDGQSGWSVAAGSVLAHASTVHRDPQWPALQALFGSDAQFLEHYSGTGALLLSAQGAVDEFALEPNELITMTPGFVLAYPDQMQCRLRAIDPAAPQSVRTGEGLAFDFAGPGTVLSRSRNPHLPG